MRKHEREGAGEIAYVSSYECFGRSSVLTEFPTTLDAVGSYPLPMGSGKKEAEAVKDPKRIASRRRLRCLTRSLSQSRGRTLRSMRMDKLNYCRARKTVNVGLRTRGTTFARNDSIQAKDGTRELGFIAGRGLNQYIHCRMIMSHGGAGSTASRSGRCERNHVFRLNLHVHNAFNLNSRSLCLLLRASKRRSDSTGVKQCDLATVVRVCSFRRSSDRINFSYLFVQPHETPFNPLAST